MGLMVSRGASSPATQLRRSALIASMENLYIQCLVALLQVFHLFQLTKHVTSERGGRR
jgi:hypothetical protein